MKQIKFLLLGIYFGIVLVKAQVVSWFRIQEMFHFQSFHMFGIIGCAVLVGSVTVALIRVLGWKTLERSEVDLSSTSFNKVGNLAGGILFGCGWALTGACPGPLYALVGAGYSVALVAIAGALLGVVAYGLLRSRLPH